MADDKNKKQNNKKDNNSKQAEKAAETRPGYDNSRDAEQRTNPSEEIKDIKDVETYDASEGQNPEVHYNANSKKGFPRDVDLRDNNGVAFAYEGSKGTDVKGAVDDE